MRGRALLAVPLVLAAATFAGADPLGYVIDRQKLDDPQVIADGEELYRTGCISCHGPTGAGVGPWPDIRDSGAAGAHFYLTTGRMPHTAGPDDQAQRKRPAYTPEEIQALVAYVATLGNGPALPRLEVGAGDLTSGGELYRLNCAACHSASGSGGALSYGHNAPPLTPATPVQVAEAIRVGPGEMPTFGRDQLSDTEVQDVVRYVQFLREHKDPGGLSLGRIGPIPEGGVAILGGLGLCILACWWIGKRRLEVDEGVMVEDEGARS
jgi:ubiquinol-cytochrome c reductase cytochrome c subunit